MLFLKNMDNNIEIIDLSVLEHEDYRNFRNASKNIL